MAGASLALVVALNLEMAPIGAVPLPDASDIGAVTASTPAGHGSGLRHWEGRAPAAGTGPVNEAPGTVIWVPSVNEQLPLDRTRCRPRRPPRRSLRPIRQTRSSFA